jgi:hypothetical protein
MSSPGKSSRRAELRIAIIFSLGLAATMFLFVLVAKQFITGPG